MGVAPQMGMSAVTINVEAQIENLRGLKGDLEEHYFAVARDGDGPWGFMLGMAVGQLTQRIAGLEEVMRHHCAEELTVVRKGIEETRSLARALDVLDGEFVVDLGMPNSVVWTRVRSILLAADEVLFAAAEGRPAQKIVRDDRPQLGVVLPLARSSR